MLVLNRSLLYRKYTLINVLNQSFLSAVTMYLSYGIFYAIYKWNVSSI
jgi:hypothetical protein